MARNVEIKARVRHVDDVLPVARAIADGDALHVQQDDTFFQCPHGRLKLRAFSADAGELIFYQRADDAGPKLSRYEIAPTASPETLRAILALAYGECGRVRKERTVYLVGNTRIHLDRVAGLGHFVELEVVLAENDRVDDGVATANAILARLGIAPSQLVQGAYVDLLRTQHEKSPARR